MTGKPRCSGDGSAESFPCGILVVASQLVTKEGPEGWHLRTPVLGWESGAGQCGFYYSILSNYRKVRMFLLEDTIRENVLASRWERFKAAAIDNLLIYIPTLILVSIYPKKEDIPNLASFTLGLYMIVVLIIQGVFLVSRGQTVGKKMVNIQIVRSKDGQNGGFLNNVLLRTFVNGLLTLIPLYLLIDILFVFSDTKRCLHDRIARTIVVKKMAAQE